MKRFILIFAALPLGLFSQAMRDTTSHNGQHNGHHRGGERQAQAVAQLSLTASQQQQWRAAAQKREQANVPLRDKLKGSTTPDERKQIHQSMKANNDAFRQEVESFLDDSQKAKFTDMQSQRKEQRKGQR